MVAWLELQADIMRYPIIENSLTKLPFTMVRDIIMYKPEFQILAFATTKGYYD